MLDLSLLLEDDDLRRRYGAATFERARDYVERGKVLKAVADVDSDGDLDVRGVVAGSTRAPYSVLVSVGLSGPGVWVYSRCSCPVVEGCKHAVALLLVVREQQEAGRSSAELGGSRWERQLASVLDELDGADGDGTRAAEQLALQVELKLPAVATSYRTWAPPATERRGILRLRPLRRGARDAWVRTGATWLDVQRMHGRRGYHPAQVSVLSDLLTTYRTASRSGYYGSESHLPLSAFPESVWHLLGRARAAGLAVVPGGALESVEVHPDTVTLQVDVQAAPGGDAHLGVGVSLAGQWYGAADVDVLGDSGHGVALWRLGEKASTWGLVLAPLARPAGPQVRRLLVAADSLVVPAEDREDLVTDYLPRLQRHVPVTSSDSSVHVPEPAMPRLALTVTWLAVDEVRIAWSWRYRVGGDDRIYAMSESRGLRGFRNPDAEAEILRGLALTDEQVYHLCDGHRRDRGLVPERTFPGGAAIVFAEDLLPGLLEDAFVEVEEIGARPDYREATHAPVVHFAARGPGAGGPGSGGPDDPLRTDWLDLEVVITVDGHALALAHLLEALTRGESRVIVGNGVHVAVDRPEFAHLAELVTAAGELHEQPRDGVRVGRADLGLWDELAQVGIVDAQAATWVRAAQALRHVDRLPEVEPVGVSAELRSYQRDGFRWLAFLWQSQLGGILADDMGLGKTLQTLALVAFARAEGSAPFLVVAPTSVVSTWAHEAATFTPGLRVQCVSESQARRRTTVAALAAEADVVVTSYTLFRLDVDDYLGETWGGLVLDEAQTVKNHQSKTYQCVRRMEVPFRLALTGTPMENRLMELWSLLSIVAPGLYPRPARFAELVATPVERLGDDVALQRFRRRIRPFLLRRTKDLVASELPPKQESVLEVRLTPRHRRIYETHLQRERQTVLGLVEEDFDKHRIAIFRSLTRLRQLSLDAGLVSEEYDGVGSAKIDVLVDHVVELMAEGHRALVFSSFTTFLGRVRIRLEAEGVECVYLDGRTRKRAEVIAAFRTGSAPVFLISLKAGGVGLTLTEADYVFVLDPWWNPAVEAQAVDRTHRIGQSRHVMVYRLVSADTIEEKVMELKARKAALFAQVVDGDGARGSAIGADDVRALFED